MRNALFLALLTISLNVAAQDIGSSTMIRVDSTAWKYRRGAIRINPFDNNYTVDLLRNADQNVITSCHLNCKVSKPTKYRLSFFSKYSGKRSGVLVWFKTVDAQNHTVDFINDYDKPVRKSKEWTRHSLSVFATSESEQIVIGVSLNKKGHLQIRDVRLEEVEQHNCTLPAQNKEIIDSVIRIARTNSVNKGSVAFAEVHENALTIAADGCSEGSKQHAIDYILSRLQDKHSFYMPARVVKLWRVMNIAGKKSKRQKISETDGYGYLKVGPFFTADQRRLTFRAASMQADIAAHSSVKGWIIDLTDNTGGNYWPMLAGVGPLLGNGLCGYFKDAEGNSKLVSYQNGAAILNEDTIVQVPAQPIIPGGLPIAILTSRNTASSGEMLALSFRGMPNVRFFGDTTAGLSSANASFSLPDGSELFITTSVFEDRTGQVYPGGLFPDVVIADERKAKEAARQWLNEMTK